MQSAIGERRRDCLALPVGDGRVTESVKTWDLKDEYFLLTSTDGLWNLSHSNRLSCLENPANPHLYLWVFNFVLTMCLHSVMLN